MTTNEALDRLRTYVSKSAEVYRKGDVVHASDLGVITIDNFPALPQDTKSVDCHFVHVGFTSTLIELGHREFYDLVVEALQSPGEFNELTVDEMRGGLSYIPLGAWLGSQTLALQYLATGAAHGLWEVITPERLGITGEQADALAGGGLVMAAGLKEPK